MRSRALKRAAQCRLSSSPRAPSVTCSSPQPIVFRPALPTKPSGGRLPHASSFLPTRRAAGQLRTASSAMRSTLLLFHSVTLCALLGSVAPKRRACNYSTAVAVVTQQQGREPPKPPLEKEEEDVDDGSLAPAEPLAEFYDALTYGDSTVKVWHAYEALSKWDRRFLTKDDYMDLLNAMSNLNYDLSVDAFLRILDDMTASKNTPRVAEYRLGFKLCLRQARLDAAEKLFAKVTESGTEPEKSFFEDLIVLYGQSGQLQRASATYREMIQAGFSRSGVVYGAMIDAATRMGDLRQAEVLFEEMLAVGLKPTVESFAALIRGNLRNERLPRATALLNDMMSRNLQPSVRIYTHFISAHGRAGNYDMALHMKRLTELSGLEPDVVYYGALISNATRAGDFEQADGLFKAMRAQNIEPSQILYDSIAAGVLGRGDVNSLLTTVARLTKLGVEIEERILNTLFLAYRKARDLAGASELLTRWKDDGRSLNSVHYTTYLSLLVDEEGVPAALKFIDEHVPREQLDPGMFNALLSYAFRLRNDSLSSLILDKMNGFGVSPDAVTYNTVMNNMTDPANLRVVEAAAAKDKSLDAVGCLTLLAHAAKRQDTAEAQRIFDMMRMLDIRLNKSTWTARAQVFAAANDIEQMEQTFRDMKEDGWDLDVVAHTSRVNAYVNVGDMAGAEQCWRELLESGCPPNSAAYSALLGGYLRTEDKTDSGARPLIEDMQARGVKPDTILATQILRWIGSQRGTRALNDALRHMTRSAGVVPDLVMYNIVLNEHKKRRAVEHILPVVADMLERGLIPDGYTYAALCHTVVGSRSPGKWTNRLLEQLGHEHTQNPALHEQFLNAQASQGSVDGVLHAWERVQQYGIKVSGPLLAACIRGLLRCGGTAQARNIWDATVTPELSSQECIKPLWNEMGGPPGPAGAIVADRK
ncbi:hypothetical protein BDZ88DRAFT_402291 [Geranomyces variabilis]|nr:hypothetical protein BDZ88DRAFT_402291 [Geranomyces variabilis]